VVIRELDLERDAADIVAVVRATQPLALVSVDAVVHRWRTLPARARARPLVAEVAGRVVGRGDAGLNFFGGDDASTFISLGVLPAYRRRGIGGALHDAALAYAQSLGAPQVTAQFDENADGVAFARARGWREVRAEQWSVLDPRTVTEPLPAGVDLRPATELDPRALHHVDMEATLDMPQVDPPAPIPYDEWLDHVWRHPLFSFEGSFGAVVDGAVAAVSLLTTDGAGRGGNMFTGTLRAYRGRGLAVAVKLATTHWAAANGITQIVTTNDETNAPMLAINRRLGYRRAGRRVEYARAWLPA
jgi:GNAT superfamily N-acetyltransferase